MTFSVIILGLTVDFFLKIICRERIFEYLNYYILHTHAYLHVHVCVCEEIYRRLPKKKTRMLYFRFITQTSWGKRRENGVPVNKITLYKMVFVYMYMLVL